MSDEQPPSIVVRAPSSERRARGRKFSDILNDIARSPTKERVSVGDLLTAMGDRAFGALMLIFALPNVLPTPPGTSAILALPLVILAAQLMLGQKPWLPSIVTNRSMPRADFAAFLGRAGPWIEKAEKLLRPRLSVLVNPPAEYAIGAVCLVLAIILILPIPLGNILPALAICLLSFGILEKDGIWAIAGALTAAVSVAIVGGVLFALAKGAIFVFTHIFT
jgi:hypothetical protein